MGFKSCVFNLSYRYLHQEKVVRDRISSHGSKWVNESGLSKEGG